MGAWTGLIWLRLGTSGGFLWTRYWTLVYHKMRAISWLAEELLAFHGGPCSVELLETPEPCSLISRMGFTAMNRSSELFCRVCVTSHCREVLALTCNMRFPSCYTCGTPSCGRWMQTTPTHLIFDLLIFFPFALDLGSGLFPPGFPSKVCAIHNLLVLAKLPSSSLSAFRYLQSSVECVCVRWVIYILWVRTV
jgi:hypothetical protein